MFRDGKIDRAGGLNRNRCILGHICAVSLERASLTAQWQIGGSATPPPFWGAFGEAAQSTHALRQGLCPIGVMLVEIRGSAIVGRLR
jgi:hypothetical protein